MSLRALLLLPVAAVFASGCITDASPAEGTPSASGVVAPTASCSPRERLIPARDFFVDISAASGIQQGNFVPNPEPPIPINDHSRVAFADIDGDGFDDIVAHSLFPNPQRGIPFEHLVFANNGDRTFRDVSDASGLRSVQAAFFVFADVDNDGDQDCFAGLDIALEGETSALYLNDGRGHFTRKQRSGVEAARLAATAVFGDFDGDGRLDLYVGAGGTTAAAPDQLFFGNGDGTFTEASQRLANRPSQPTNGVVACDYDGDGDLDVLVSHYGVSVGLGWRALWENDGRGNFTNVARKRGFNALATGNRFLESTGRGRTPQPVDPSKYVGSNGFGIDCQDIDGDGTMDVWLAAISHPVDSDESRKWSDPSMFLRGRGAEGGFGFEDVTARAKLPFNEGDIDAAAIDFDNDGRMDLSVTRDRKYEAAYDSPEQKAWFGLFHQSEDGTFRSVGLESGINDRSGASDRGKGGQNLGWSDIDGDGDLDVLVGGRDSDGKGRANLLFENTLGQSNGWLGVRLRGDGVHVNRDAIGARVTVTTQGRSWIREVRSSRGTYASADMRAPLFGLGDAGCSGGSAAVSIEVRWPDGTKTLVEPGRVALHRYVTVDYATGLAPDPR